MIDQNLVGQNKKGIRERNRVSEGKEERNKQAKRKRWRKKNQVKLINVQYKYFTITPGSIELVFIGRYE